MSHIDEGELTAYADGAYAPESAEAQRLRAHLATCANCRNRLADAQALSARAGALLELAAPAPFEMPAFEELQRRAGATARKQRVLPLAWAATVVLAIGLGWLTRGWLSAPAPERVAVSAAPKSAPPRLASPTSANTQIGSPAALGEPRDERVASNTPARPLAQPQRNESQAAATTPAQAQPAAAQVAEAAGAVRTSEPEYITAAEAERRGIKLHIVPELEVLRVALRPDTAVIEQKLPDAKVLTITQTLAVDETKAYLRDAVAENAMRAKQTPVRAEERRVAAPPAAPAVQKMAQQSTPGVVVTRAGVRVWLMAPVSIDSLRALAGQIR